MAECPTADESSKHGELVGRARGRKNNLSLEIRIENFDDCKASNSSVGQREFTSSPNGSQGGGGGGLKEREGSLKARRSTLLQHFLHPLDYYHERKSRSSTSSINSDFGDLSGGDSTPRCRTPEPQTKSKSKLFSRPHSPHFFLNSPVWPVYKPPLRKRVSCPSPYSSPYHSPISSPCGSPSPNQNIDFHKNASQNSDTRYPDGHGATDRQQRSRYSVSPEMLLPKRSYNAYYDSKTSENCSDTRGSSQPKSRREIEKGEGGYSSSGGSSSGSSGSDDDDSSSNGSNSDHEDPSSSLEEVTDDERNSPRHRRPRDGDRRVSRSNHPSGQKGQKEIPFVKISLPNSGHEPSSSPAVSPVNKFLLSVRSQEGSNEVPDRRVGGKSLSYNVPRKRRSYDDYDDDDVFAEYDHRQCDPSRRSLHLGMESDKSHMERASSVERLYAVYEEIIREGQLVRRHSMEPERKRNGSGSSFGHTYLRGEDPNQAAIIFRDCRGLPAAAPFLETVKRSELEEDESQILVKFFKYHSTYDLIPTSAKLVVFDTRLQVKKAFYALVYNGVRAAPLWDAERQQFVGMLTITDFIRILQSFYNSPNRKMEELEEHRLEMWRNLLNDNVRKLISITPNECLYEAIRSLIHHKIHRLPVIDPSTGNVLYIITHKRILKFLFLYINELPKPSILLKSLRELNIGTYDNIETAKGETLIIEALNKFVERRISALPIVDEEGKLIDIYAKFDVINLAAEGTYHNLDVTLHQANEYRNEWFEGVLKCTLDETMEMIMERIVRAEVHRLVVVDKNNKVIGIISLSDILNELVLKPCHDDPTSLRGKTVAQMQSALNGDRSECSASGDDLNHDSSATLDIALKTKSWDSAEPQNEDSKQDGPSSSAESIDYAKYIDVNKIS